MDLSYKKDLKVWKLDKYEMDMAKYSCQQPSLAFASLIFHTPGKTLAWWVLSEMFGIFFSFLYAPYFFTLFLVTLTLGLIFCCWNFDPGKIKTRESVAHIISPLCFFLVTFAIGFKVWSRQFEILIQARSKQNKKRGTHYFPALLLLTTGSHWLAPLTVWCSCCCPPKIRNKILTMTNAFNNLDTYIFRFLMWSAQLDFVTYIRPKVTQNFYGFEGMKITAFHNVPDINVRTLLHSDR